MRKFLLVPLIVFFGIIFLSAGTIPADGIRLSVTNLRNDRGFILISLFREGAGYPDKPALAFKTDKVAIYDKKAVIIFPDMPAGTYAISILHDENNDQQMNKNALGLPKEGYGFSNNVMGAFGPPSYKRASFTHKKGAQTEVQIRARY
jgi:uncharacterized protein (DUF2141 family)